MRELDETKSALHQVASERLVDGGGTLTKFGHFLGRGLQFEALRPGLTLRKLGSPALPFGLPSSGAAPPAGSYGTGHTNKR